MRCVFQSLPDCAFCPGVLETALPSRPCLLPLTAHAVGGLNQESSDCLRLTLCLLQTQILWFVPRLPNICSLSAACASCSIFHQCPHSKAPFSSLPTETNVLRLREYCVIHRCAYSVLSSLSQMEVSQRQGLYYSSTAYVFC